MASDDWTLDDGIQLQALMVCLKLDDWQVGQLSALSIHQVRELLSGVPNGKASCFYSAAIKRHAGQRLLVSLGEGVGSDTR